MHQWGGGGGNCTTHTKPFRGKIRGLSVACCTRLQDTHRHVQMLMGHAHDAKKKILTMHSTESSICYLSLLLNKDSANLPIGVPHNLELPHMLPRNGRDASRLQASGFRVGGCINVTFHMIAIAQLQDIRVQAHVHVLDHCTPWTFETFSGGIVVYNVCSTKQLVMAIVPLPSRPRGLDWGGGGGGEGIRSLWCAG